MSKPRPVNVRKTLLAAGILLLFFLYTYTRDPGAGGLHVLRGHTMGTTYEIKLADFQGRRSDLRALKVEIENRLEELNLQMSTWLPDSEISAFNAYTVDLPFRVSREFAEVTRFALQLSRDTDGAFDPTLGPLIDLWGFGAAPARVAPPTQAEVDAAMAACGYRHLSVPAVQQLVKKRSKLQLNLSAVAKGFAVDDVWKHLAEAGQTNCYVEIGGEVRVSGFNQDKAPWRIGVEAPEPSLPRASPPLRVLHLTNAAVATSGDYRNFFKAPDGRRYSHILDPRTGRPVTNQVAEASVIAGTCMEADGIATALLVMPPEAGMAWVNQRQDVEALLVLHGPDESYQELESSGFAAYAEPK